MAFHYYSDFQNIFSTGTSITVDVRYSTGLLKSGGYYINIRMALTADYKGNTYGLCGFMDDDTSNDFQHRDGKFIKPEETNITAFAESCKLKLSYVTTFMHFFSNTLPG